MREKRHSEQTTLIKNQGFDDENDDYVIKQDEIWNQRFQVLKLIGRGSFGQVVEALDLLSGGKVAIKIIKNRPAFTNQAHMEIRIVKFLNSKDPEDVKNVGM